MKVLAIEAEPLIRDIHSEFLELLGREAALRFLRKPVAFAEFKATLAEVAEHAGAAR
jgi:hypothetical protein